MDALSAFAGAEGETAGRTGTALFLLVGDALGATASAVGLFAALGERGAVVFKLDARIAAVFAGFGLGGVGFAWVGFAVGAADGAGVGRADGLGGRVSVGGVAIAGVAVAGAEGNATTAVGSVVGTRGEPKKCASAPPSSNPAKMTTITRGKSGSPPPASSSDRRRRRGSLIRPSLS